MGLCLFVVLAVAIGLARLVLRKGSYATITGKAFRRARCAWVQGPGRW
jgi:hypothetical protein